MVATKVQILIVVDPYSLNIKGSRWHIICSKRTVEQMDEHSARQKLNPDVDGSDTTKNQRIALL
jgi:hypothetical protein